MAALRPAGRRVGLVGLLTGLLLAGAPAQGQDAPKSTVSRELVVLVHGLGRTLGSMWPMERALEAKGYEVLNFGYSSTCCEIPELGEQLRDTVLRHLDARHTSVHFVGHSLGGILIRWVLTRDSLPPRVGRVVMLAPPNQGSHAADRYAPLVGWLLRPMQELRTDTASTVQRLPRLRGIEAGVIAGDDDGKVDVRQTHLPGETDHIVVDGTHSFLMGDREVQRQTLAFLRTGKFEREPILGPIP
jgi:triacylglycerol esterase/lipase EstA (alpha/beta hydrolase family)